MKKSLIAVLVAAVLVASFSVVGSVYAQSETPGYGYGNGVQQQLQTEDGLGYTMMRSWQPSLKPSI